MGGLSDTLERSRAKQVNLDDFPWITIEIGFWKMVVSFGRNFRYFTDLAVVDIAPNCRFHIWSVKNRMDCSVGSILPRMVEICVIPC